MFVGITGFALGFLIGDGEDGTIKYSYELPLGKIEGFVVDDSKNIFVGSAFYSMVQMYDSNGRFIRHWDIGRQTQGGSFHVDIKHGDSIVISATRTDSQVVFNKFGNIVESERIPDIYEKTERDFKIFTMPNGDKYELQGLLLTKIAQTYPLHKTIITQNLLLEIYKGPRVWFFIGLGYLLIFLIKGNLIIAKRIGYLLSFLVILPFLWYLIQLITK